MAQLTGDPLSRIVGQMRSLREAELVVANKGRGITAPRMTPRDAAALYCAIYASPTIQDSSSTLIKLQKLESQGRVRYPPKSRWNRDYRIPTLTLGLDRVHSVVDGLAAAISFFMNEEKLGREYDEWRFGPGKKFGIYANFEIRSPELSASLTLGVHGDHSEEWIYGQRGELDSIRTGGCSEVTLRKLAACLKS